MYYPRPNSLNNQFTDIAVASQLAENNANDLNKGLNLTSLGSLCGLLTTKHGTNEIKCILPQEVYDHYSISEEYLS